MSARDKTYRIMNALDRRGIDLSYDEIHTLRRAEMTLHRWAERECGESNQRASWAIERDETDGRPYCVTVAHSDGSRWRTRIADRENGALKRIAALCGANGLHYWHQTDPRGCALYISTEPLTDSTYTNGVAIC